MNRMRLLKGALAIGIALAVAGCNGDSPTAPGGGGGGGGGVGAEAVTSITVSGGLQVAEGSTTQLTATARRGNGTTEDVTGQAIWRTSDSGIATVSSTGLVTGVRTGTAEISATFNNVTGRANVTVNAARWRLAVNISSVRAIGTCDLVGDGEFAVRVQSVEPDGTRETIVQTSSYPGDPDNLRIFPLGKDESETLNEDRTYTVVGANGNRLRIEFSATEWDQEVVVFPPSTRWVRDSDMNDLTSGRNHSFSAGAFSSLGSNTLDVGGTTSCAIRLNYRVTATKLD